MDRPRNAESRRGSKRSFSSILSAFGRLGPLRFASRAAGAVIDYVHTRLYSWAIGFQVGPGTIVKPGARIRLQGGQVRIGSESLIHAKAMIMAHGGSIAIGDRFSLNPFSIVYGHGGVQVGNDVLVAAGSIIIPANHRFEFGSPIRDQGLSIVGITVADDVWVGTGVTILDGSIIGRGAILAAGCVVTGSVVPEFAIFGGVPGKMIGTRA